MNRKYFRVGVTIATMAVCGFTTSMPASTAVQTALSDDVIHNQPGENAVLRLPRVTVTPSDPFTDPKYYGRVLKHLPCLGTCDEPNVAQPSRLLKALLWMLYPIHPPELTEPDRLRIQIKRDNQRTEKLP